MKRRSIVIIALVGVCLTLSSVLSVVYGRGGGPHFRPVVFVKSQGLYYDSIIGPELPHKGRFQRLEFGGITGMMAEFGPGDPEYTPRFWVDKNANGEVDDDERCRLYVLLGPGRRDPY